MRDLIEKKVDKQVKKLESKRVHDVSYTHVNPSQVVSG